MYQKSFINSLNTPIFHTCTKQELDTYIAKWLKKAKIHTPKSLCNYITLFADKGHQAKTTDNQDEYFFIKAWSNSKLSELKSTLMGKPQTFPSRAFTFGSALHEWLLEPENFDIRQFVLRPSEENTINNMIESCLNDKLLMSAIRTGIIEQTVVWNDHETKLPCKGKIDITPASDLVIDIKSTSAQTESEFIESCQKYEYERQLAFYMDGTRRNNALIVGISKAKPHSIFYYEMNRYGTQGRNGRKKYRFLLNKAKNLNLAP